MRAVNPTCTECGKPVACKQGRYHYVCAPRCRVCWQPIGSNMPMDDGPVHTRCPGTKDVRQAS